MRVQKLKRKKGIYYDGLLRQSQHIMMRFPIPWVMYVVTIYRPKRRKMAT